MYIEVCFSFEDQELKGNCLYVVCIILLSRYCYKILENYPPASAAPLLCAGITVYTPMVRHNMNKPGTTLTNSASMFCFFRGLDLGILCNFGAKNCVEYNFFGLFLWSVVWQILFS